VARHSTYIEQFQILSKESRLVVESYLAKDEFTSMYSFLRLHSTSIPKLKFFNF